MLGIARLLTQGQWIHDYPITFDNAREMGLPVTPDMPKLVSEIMSLYSQPVRQSMSVESIPEPRSKRMGNRLWRISRKRTHIRANT